MNEHSKDTHFLREVEDGKDVHAVTREGVVEDAGGISLEVEMEALVRELDEELRKRGGNESVG